ncbi:hypothetical protein DFJ73DRAFT_774064 [Zopfochytrium polystomum]|nr:hypothetical protein DFJ73DRAFT_774064 [Zopfochytrium polystomum]
MANHPNLVPPAAVVPPPGPAQPPPAPSQHGSVRSLLTNGDALELILTLTTTTMRAPRPTTPYGTRRAAAAGRWLEMPNFIKNFSEAMQINSRNSAATCTDAQAAAFIATFNTPYELYVVGNVGYMQLDYLLDCSALDCKYTTSHDTFALHTNQHGLKTVIHHSGDWNKAFERYTNMHKLILHDDGGMITTIDHRVTFEACYLADEEWRCRAAFEPDLKLTDQAERGPLFLQYVSSAKTGAASPTRRPVPRNWGRPTSPTRSWQTQAPTASRPIFLNTEGLGDSRHYCINFNVDNCSNAHALDPMSVLSVWPLAFRLFTPAPVSATPTTSNVFVLYRPGKTRLHLPAPPSAKPQLPYQSTHNQRPHPLGLPLQTPLLLPPLISPAATLEPRSIRAGLVGCSLILKYFRLAYKVLEAALRKAIPWKIVHTICLGKLARYLRRHPNKPFTQSLLSGCSSSYRRRRLEVSYDYTLGDQRMRLLNTSRMHAKMASVSGIRLYDSGSTTAPLRRITTTTHLYTLAANCLGTQTIKESQSTSTPTVPVDISTTPSSSP